jgi:hypothetical protein
MSSARLSPCLALCAGLLVVGVVACFVAVAGEPDSADFQKLCAGGSFPVYFVVGNRPVAIEIPLAELEASPPWDTAGGKEPPVTIGRAVQLAKAELRRAVKDAGNWTVKSVTLRSACANRAYYEVVLRRKDRFGDPNYTIPVLMSGVVVPTAERIQEAK